MTPVTVNTTQTAIATDAESWAHLKAELLASTIPDLAVSFNESTMTATLTYTATYTPE